MHRDRFRYTPQHESVNAAVAVRADHDQVCAPVLCLIQDHLPRVADGEKFSFDSLDSGFTQDVPGTGYSFFSPPRARFSIVSKRSGGG
jgi:hypothetical protein